MPSGRASIPLTEGFGKGDLKIAKALDELA
jgi:hypothetical protein